MRSPVSRFAGALLHRRDWARHGVHSRALASPVFTQVFTGFYTPSEHPASLGAMAWVLQNRVLPGAVISHTTAAVLWGIPIPWAIDRGIGLLRSQAGSPHAVLPRIPAVLPGRTLDGPMTLPVLHCRLEAASRSRSAKGAVVHRWAVGESEPLERLLVSSPLEVLRELDAVLLPWDHAAAIEAVIGPAWPHRRASLEDIREFCRSHSGEHGIGGLASAGGPEFSDQVRSPGESVMKRLIGAVGLPMPTPNLRVRDPLTGSIRLLDLAWEAERFALEYDGDGHRMTKDQWRLDEIRRDELAGHGWTLSRCNGADLAQPLRILLRIERTLRSRGVATPTPAQIEAALCRVLDRRPSLMLGPRASRRSL